MGLITRRRSLVFIAHEPCRERTEPGECYRTRNARMGELWLSCSARATLREYAVWVEWSQGWIRVDHMIACKSSLTQLGLSTSSSRWFVTVASPFCFTNIVASPFISSTNCSIPPAGILMSALQQVASTEFYSWETLFSSKIPEFLHGPPVHSTHAVWGLGTSEFFFFAIALSICGLHL